MAQSTIPEDVLKDSKSLAKELIARKVDLVEKACRSLTSMASRKVSRGMGDDAVEYKYELSKAQLDYIESKCNAALSTALASVKSAKRTATPRTEIPD